VVGFVQRAQCCGTRCARNCDPNDPNTQPYARATTLNQQDWAPYSDTTSAGATTFSKGIWKSVYIVGVARASAAITHVAPRVFYKGAYPSAPLTDGAHGDFSVDVVVHFAAPAATTGSLTVAGAWGATATVPVALPAGASNVTVTLAAADNAVKLWWPAQTPLSVGAQTLYNLSVAFTEAGGAVTKADARRIGFRVFTLVTGNDTDPTTLAGKDGQTGFTMRFKVNGADIWSRGANMIVRPRAPQRERPPRPRATAFPHNSPTRHAPPAPLNKTADGGDGGAVERRGAPPPRAERGRGRLQHVPPLGRWHISVGCMV
jgi:hypothetical protein